MAELFELNPEYSTTRLVTREVPKLEEPPDAAFKTMFFLPEGEGRKGEGGLRTQGYFKRSLPGKPLITVITVVFNGAQHIEQTMLSVIGQTYDNVEYIVIDGGSTDGTIELIKKYEHAIDYWVSEKDGGIYEAMNKGIFLFSGDWVNFMNSGDFFFSPSIFKEIQLDVSNDMIYGNHAVYKNDEKIYNKVDTGEYSGVRNIPYCHQSLFTKRELIMKFIFDLRYRVAADYDQYMKCKRYNAKIIHIPKTISIVLHGGISYVERKRLIGEYYKIMKYYSPIYAFFVFFIRKIFFIFQRFKYGSILNSCAFI